jgi:hypothetical protein
LSFDAEVLVIGQQALKPSLAVKAAGYAGVDLLALARRLLYLRRLRDGCWGRRLLGLQSFSS